MTQNYWTDLVLMYKFQECTSFGVS
uniref:Uncharacterized protein n=1 Tax=Anguilla anguilla TaxID=7936 RepID=A0A0E9Y069_ANGAN